VPQGVQRSDISHVSFLRERKEEVIMAKRLLPILLLIVLASCAHMGPKKETLTIGFHNQSNETMVYHLYWLDNPGVDPVEVAVGELAPGELNTINRMEGYYLIMWVDMPSYDVVYVEPFRHFNNTTFVYK